MSHCVELSSIRSMLVISLTNLGDVILTTPVLGTLRANFPQARIAVLAGPKAEGLLRGSRTINEFILFDKRALRFGAKLKLVWALRRQSFDLVVDLRNTLIPYLICARRRSKPVVGKQLVSMRERHLARLGFLNLPIESGPFDFFSETEATQAEEKMKLLGLAIGQPYCVMVPGAGSYLKRWKLERFGEVAHHFEQRGMRVVAVGSPAEKELGAQLESCAHAINACGVFGLRELAAFLKHAKFVLSCDSAIMHLANELDVPAAAIFGPTDEKKYARMDSRHRVIRRVLDCAPCERAHCRFERAHCMEDITSGEVIKMCEELSDAARH